MEDEGGRRSSHRDIRCDVVLEQTLGHVTHGQNLRRLLVDAPSFTPRFLPVAFDNDSWTRRIPGFGNWTVRAGVRARRALRRVGTDRDALFVHTQVPAVLLGRLIGRVPTVVSLDATPKQYDELGEHYAHDVGPAWVERIKTRLNRRCFERADHLVTWAAWTKQNLADEYGAFAATRSAASVGAAAAAPARGASTAHVVSRGSAAAGCAIPNGRGTLGARRDLVEA